MKTQTYRLIGNRVIVSETSISEKDYQFLIHTQGNTDGNNSGRNIIRYTSRKGNEIISFEENVSFRACYGVTFAVPRYLQGLVLAYYRGGEILTPPGLTVSAEDNRYVNEKETLAYYNIIRDGNGYRKLIPMFSYHEYSGFRYDLKPQILTGFEIEKNSWNGVNKIDALNALKQYGVRIESDSSVSNGFELITPPLPLFGAKIIKYGQIFKDYINVSDVRNAGCHTNISFPFCTGIETFLQIKNAIPLLYTIFNERERNSYCAFKNVHELMNSRDRYSFCIKNDFVEARLFPAITDFNDYLKRINFIRWLVRMRSKNPVDLAKVVINNINTSPVPYTDKYTENDFKLAYRHYFERYASEQMKRLHSKQLQTL